MKVTSQTYLKYGLLICFLLISAGLIVYDTMVTKPARTCEEAGDWYNHDLRRCFVKVDITTYTGRERPNIPTPQREGTQSSSARP